MTGESSDALAPGEGPASKVSVSLPEGTVRAIRERVGARQFSRFVAEATERELRRQNLDDLIAAHEREHGEVPADLIERAEELWDEAERRHAAWVDAERA